MEKSKPLLQQMDERANKVLRELLDKTMTEVCTAMIKKREKEKAKHDK